MQRPSTKRPRPTRRNEVRPEGIIAWMADKKGDPVILGIFDRLFASTGLVRHNTYAGLERLFGGARVQVALRRYRARPSHQRKSAA